MEKFEGWIGKKEIITDYVYTKPALMMQAILNQSHSKLNSLPHLNHWFYCLPTVNNTELAIDGHPKKGGFLPPIPFPKRMWAGSRLIFLQSIQFNQKIKRESEITQVKLKRGKSGEMYVVTVKHLTFVNDILAIIEEQDIIYRNATNQIQTTPPIIEPIANTQYEVSYKKAFPINTVTLFRYSALTFNSHRIHYDRPYSIEHEGYPSLVIHAPLLATLLLQTFKEENPKKHITHYEFKAVNPAFDFDEILFCGNIHNDNGELWIEKSNGQICMKAKVKFLGD
jgi:3-methylfumaryl-CoA hydratase